MSSRDKCVVCGKTAYAMERMVADNKTFHKTCMKCEHCKKTLGLGNFAALNGKYYCKPHFKQLFQTKGNYSDGFGEEKPTAKWENKGVVYAGATPGADFTKPSKAAAPVAKATPAPVKETPKPEPVKEEPAPVKEEPKEEPAPVVEEPKEEPAPAAEEPKEEPAAEEPAPVAEEPVAEEPAAEEPAPVVEEPKPEPVKEEPAPVKEEPKEEPAPVKEEPAPVKEEPKPAAKGPDTPTVTKAAPVSSGGGFKVKIEKCSVCGKSVYAMDKMVADGVIFHKTCMKCEHCKKTLGLGNFAALNGKYYCKPHFKQLFQTKGNYSDGFGEDKPTAKWEPQVAAYATGTKKFC